MLAYFPTTTENAINIQRGRRYHHVLPQANETTGRIHLFLREDQAIAEAQKQRQAMALVEATKRFQIARQQYERYKDTDKHLAEIWGKDNKVEIRQQDRQEMSLVLIDLDEAQISAVLGRPFDPQADELLKLTPESYKTLTEGRSLAQCLVEGTENLAALYGNRSFECGAGWGI